MYKKIYIPVDNSELSNRSIELGTKLAGIFDGKCIGSHVYAAVLHDLRFRQMESGLPPKYLQEEVLEEQRDIHDNLITNGLNVISESYLDVFSKICKEKKIESERVSLEGRNFEELAKDINKNDYDLVVLGCTGQGIIKTSLVGSVCERVVRRIKTDTIVVKNTKNLEGGKIIVGLDGSGESYGGLLTAVELAQVLNMKVEIVSVFDPNFHYSVFNSIAEVLSEEDGNKFNFKDQEKLHEEIIDSGLAKIYQQFLNIGQKLVKDKYDFDAEITLLPGKGYDKLFDKVEEDKPALLIIGRVGVHSEGEMDIGNTTENMLRLVKCNMLISSRVFHPPIERKVEEIIEWSKEALETLEKIPSFVRNMAKKSIEENAMSNGHTVVTRSIINTVMKSIMPTDIPDSMRDKMK